MKSTKKKTAGPFNLAICLMALIFLIPLGCTSQKKVAQKGFLNDYNRLQADTEMDDKGAQFWKSPDVDFKKYKKFMLDPVSYFVTPDQFPEGHVINTQLANNTTAYFTKQILAALPPEFEVVDQAGPDVARLRMVLTGISVDRKSLKAYQYVPVALVLTTVSEATGNRDSIAVLSMEGQVIDSLTGQVVAEVLQQAGTEVGVKKIEDATDQDVYPNLDFWAQKLKQRLLNTQK
jgi:hypothetical protein